jgi:hypothetical protein
MAAFEFGNLGTDVGAPLNQQIVVRDLPRREIKLTSVIAK